MTGSNRDSLIVAAAAVIRKNGKVLICRRPGGSKLAGYWEFPGGKVEQDEDPEKALARELLEELGIRAAIGDEILAVSHHYEYGTVELHFFTAEILKGEAKPHHHAEIRWVEIPALATYTFPPANTDLISLLIHSVDE